MIGAIWPTGTTPFINKAREPTRKIVARIPHNQYALRGVASRNWPADRDCTWPACAARRRKKCAMYAFPGSCNARTSSPDTWRCSEMASRRSRIPTTPNGKSNNPRISSTALRTRPVAIRIKNRDSVRTNICTNVASN